MEDALDEWRERTRDPDVLEDIMDGRVWITLPSPSLNGRPFFDNDHDREDADELRIGVTLGFDG